MEGCTEDLTESTELINFVRLVRVSFDYGSHWQVVRNFVYDRIVFKEEGSTAMSLDTLVVERR
jgi:hypothetical protein